MKFETIHTFDDFCPALRQAGFSVGGENDEGIFSLCRYFGPNVEWHTGDQQTDPWVWRIRGVEECRDLAYAKVFFRKGGWITREWYPYFVCVRRAGKPMEQLYSEGVISQMARDIYAILREHGEASLHEMKRMLEIDRAKDSKFQGGLLQLQMLMLITICGESFKRNKDGAPYGWPVTVLCGVERFFDGEVAREAREMDPAAAAEKIAQRVRELNPQVQEKQLKKFIFG